MEILVYSIQKSLTDSFESEIKQYIKMSSKYAKITDNVIFNDKIAKAQSVSETMSHRAYEDAYETKFKGFCVVLDERGKDLNSFEFAKILRENSQISFFIGGAYGFSEKLRQKGDLVMSLSKLTMAHKIAKLMLFEQIFRGLCINANHPYHK